MVRGIVVCVEFDDLLAITLRRAAQHLEEILVVTTPADIRTHDVVAAIPAARCFSTDAFTRGGAQFNKGLAIEEGFDALGREGWILIFDADIILPAVMTFDDLDPKVLYGAKRRMLNDPRQYRGDLDWQTLPLCPESGYPGYFQLFHASAVPDLPWYDGTFRHAAGSDGLFQSRWPHCYKARLPIEVLHLGERHTNWFGRVSERLDNIPITEAEERANSMKSLMRQYGWLDQPSSQVHQLHRPDGTGAIGHGTILTTIRTEPAEERIV